MIVALILLGYAATLAHVGPRLMRRGGWTDRAPRLGVAGWQSLTFTVLLSVTLAGTALVMPSVRISSGLADVLRTCVMALRAQYATPGGAAAGATGAVLAVAAAARCGWCVTSAMHRAARCRSRQREVLAVTGQSRPELGAVVLGNAEPAVYCLPGRGRNIVVTAGALELLDHRQLAAALAHERAHLDQRHDLVIAFATGMARAFSRVPLFTQGLSETRRLVELLADDVAIESTDRLTLAEALLTLAGARTPAAALGVGGSSAARVRRLVAPDHPLNRRRRAGTFLGVLGLLIAPMIALATPAVAATQMNYCATQVVAPSSGSHH